MSQSPVRLRDIVWPLEPMELESGRVLEARPFRYRQEVQWAAVQQMPPGPEQDAAILDLVRFVLPDLTDEELGEMGVEHMLAVIAHGRRQLAAVLAALPKPESPAVAARRRRRSK